MWHKELLSWNPYSKIREWLYHDPHTGAIAIETEGDVEDIVEDAKGRYNMVDENERWREGYNHVASIPLQVIDKIRREKGVNLLTDRRALREFLNDKDNRAFRTRPGRV